MKKLSKILALVLASLMLLTCFAACGDKPEETTAQKDETTAAPVTEDPRDAVKDEVPTDLNYSSLSADEKTVTFFQRTQFPYEIECDEILNDVLYDAIHYRNIDIETRLGIEIATIQQSGGYSERNEWNNTLLTAVLTNSSDYDAAAIYTSTGTMIAKEGAFYNLMNLTKEYGDGYLDFEKPWWNQSLLEELTLYGTLFYCGGDIASTQMQKVLCLFFNKGLFDESFPEEQYSHLYELVQQKQWTIDKMCDYVDNVWKDLNSSGIADSGDIGGVRTPPYGTGAGSMDAWLYALGLDVIEFDQYGDPVITIQDEPNMIPAYELVRKMYVESPGAVNVQEGTSDTTFNNNNLLFELLYLESGAAMRELNFEYGVLPVPMLNEEQGRYYSTPESTCSLFTILSNVSEERAVMLSAVFELMAAESYKQVTPAYYGTVLQGQYSREENDAKMFDIILENRIIPFSHIYSQSIGVITHVFRNMDPTFDMQSKIDSNKVVWQEKLAELVEGLEDAGM